MIEENYTSAEITHIDDNIKRVLYFIERTDNNIPKIPSDIPISQLIRQYLNDDDFSIEVKGISVFVQKNEDEIMQKMYQQLDTSCQQKNNLESFIQYWIKSCPHLQVTYSLYDDICKNEEPSIYKHVQLMDKLIKKQFSNQKGNSQAKQSYNSGKSVIMIKVINKISRNYSNPIQFLQKFFIFYSKKQLNSNCIETFNQYQQQCNSINLTKWMRYCKDVGLSRINKLASIKLSKQTFVKLEDKNKQLTFERFQAAVQSLLKAAYQNDEQKMKNEGYSLIGIKDYQSFQRKFQQMGQIVPNYCLPANFGRNKSNIESKTSLKYNLTTRYKQLQASIDSNIPRPELQFKKPSVLSLPKIRQQRLNKQTSEISRNSKDEQTFNLSAKNPNFSKQSNIELRDSTFDRPLKRKPNKERQLFLNELMQQVEDDPYLKRYNDKQNVGRYRCIAHRIDERIQKIKQKY